MPKYKKGQVWNKPKNKLMLDFEKTGKSAIHNGKITGQFEYWLWQLEKKKTKPKQSPDMATLSYSNKYSKIKNQKINIHNTLSRGVSRKDREKYVEDLRKYGNIVFVGNKNYEDIINHYKRWKKHQKNKKPTKKKKYKITIDENKRFGISDNFARWNYTGKINGKEYLFTRTYDSYEYNKKPRKYVLIQYFSNRRYSSMPVLTADEKNAIIKAINNKSHLSFEKGRNIKGRIYTDYDYKYSKV